MDIGKPLRVIKVEPLKLMMDDPDHPTAGPIPTAAPPAASAQPADERSRSHPESSHGRR